MFNGKQIVSDFRAQFSIGKVLAFVLMFAIVIPLILKYLRKTPVVGAALAKAESAASLVIATLILGIGLLAGHDANAQAVQIFKGGATILTSPRNQASMTNFPNFGYSAPLRVVGQNGTNQFGVATNGLPFLVGPGGTNYPGYTGILYVTNVGGVVVPWYFRGGLLITSNQVQAAF